VALVIFFAAVIVAVLAVAVFYDVKRRSTRRLPDDVHTSHKLTKPREGSEFRHGSPGGPSQ
jgi:hypothetical protein